MMKTIASILLFVTLSPKLPESDIIWRKIGEGTCYVESTRIIVRVDGVGKWASIMDRSPDGRKAVVTCRSGVFDIWVGRYLPDRRRIRFSSDSDEDDR